MASQSSARNFASAFASEEHLRQSLRVLFSRMPSVHGVQITHGSQELGKDLVFYVPNFMGAQELYACVVKHTKIDGTVSKAGAREVLTQALEAFDSPHINTEGQEEHVTKVFIISPHDCPPATMNSVKGALKSRAGQVQFLCGSLLMDAFNSHWQDFLLFESSALNTYVASLARHLLDKDPIHFILKAQQLLGGELESLEGRYVDQELKKTLKTFKLLADTKILTREGFAGLLTLVDVRSKVGSLKSFATLYESRTFSGGFSEADHTLRSCYWITGQSTSEVSTEAAATEQLSTPFSASLSSDQQDKILSILSELSTDLMKEWEASHTEAVRMQQSLRRENKLWEASEINTFSFRLSEAWFETHENELKLASESLQSLSNTLLFSNRYVEGIKQKTALPNDVGFSAFSNIEDIVREAPGFFSTTGSTKTMHLKREKLLLSRCANLLITAPAGYGKTSFCKIHAVRDAVALSEKKSKVIPVYVPLSNFATNEIVSDTAFISLPELKPIMNQGKPAEMAWNFYLDGLDEVADYGQRVLLMKCARKVLSALPLARIIVTSRNYVSGPELAWLTRVELAELGADSLMALAAKWLPSASDVASFSKQLNNSPALSRLCKVPLIATLTLAVFKKDPSLPRNKAALYKTFTELLCGGWDYVKGVNRDSHFGRHDKLRILIRFAGLLHMDKRTNGAERDLRRAVADVHSELLSSFDRLRDELVEDGLVQLAGVDIVFSHLSFQEYLASLEFGDPSGERSNALLSTYLRGDDWWSEVIAFYVAGPNRPDEMERWVRMGTKRTQASVFTDGSRERFLISSIMEAFPGWKPRNA